MDTDMAVDETPAIRFENFQPPNLNVRAQPKQYEMDWDQFNWVRSVKANIDSQLKVTVTRNSFNFKHTPIIGPA